MAAPEKSGLPVVWSATQWVLITNRTGCRLKAATADKAARVAGPVARVSMTTRPSPVATTVMGSSR